MVAQEIATVDYGELAFGLLHGLVDARIDRGAAGALKVSVFVDDDIGIFGLLGVVYDFFGLAIVNLGVVADIAIVLIWRYYREEIVIVVVGGSTIAVNNEKTSYANKSNGQNSYYDTYC